MDLSLPQQEISLTPRIESSPVSQVKSPRKYENSAATTFRQPVLRKTDTTSAHYHLDSLAYLHSNPSVLEELSVSELENRLREVEHLIKKSVNPTIGSAAIRKVNHRASPKRTVDVVSERPLYSKNQLKDLNVDLPRPHHQRPKVRWQVPNKTDNGTRQPQMKVPKHTPPLQNNREPLQNSRLPTANQRSIRQNKSTVPSSPRMVRIHRPSDNPFSWVENAKSDMK
jgi:hypothetical protein